MMEALSRLPASEIASRKQSGQCQVWSLKGFLDYDQVRKLQLALVELRCLDRIPDTLLFLEHQPVITRGRGLQFTGVPRQRHMPLMHQIPSDISFAESERGGDLTYHGPGQWVLYPICKLNGMGLAPRHDVAGFLRMLENAVIDELAQRGVEAGIKPHATGVWIKEKKIASIGIAVRKWVTYHGLALNCTNDLAPFHLISPCGFTPDVMTRLADWVDLEPNWRENLETSLIKRILGSVERASLELDEAIELSSRASESA